MPFIVRSANLFTSCFLAHCCYQLSSFILFSNPPNSYTNPLSKENQASKQRKNITKHTLNDENPKILNDSKTREPCFKYKFLLNLKPRNLPLEWLIKESSDEGAAWFVGCSIWINISRCCLSLSFFFSSPGISGFEVIFVYLSIYICLWSSSISNPFMGVCADHYWSISRHRY